MGKLKVTKERLNEGLINLLKRILKDAVDVIAQVGREDTSRVSELVCARGQRCSHTFFNLNEPSILYSILQTRHLNF